MVLMKVFLFLLGVLFLGCDSLKSVSLEVVPGIYSVFSVEGERVGNSFYYKDTFILPEHVYEEGILIEGSRYEILLRDFARDVVFLMGKDVSKDMMKRTAGLSSRLPEIGMELYRWDGIGFEVHRVEAVDVSFEIHGSVKKNLLQLSGSVDPGVSGMPVFDQKGVVYGMIMGSDRKKDQSYAVRSDIIKKMLP